LTPDRIRVVYVMGCGRSGSTLLGRLLGSSDGALHLGEATAALLSPHSARTSGACECGAPLEECSLWGRSDSPFRGTRGAASGIGLGSFVGLWRGRRDVREEVRAIHRLYRFAASVSGARTLVDTSKLPALGLLLRAAEHLDVRLVHLVRDARGFVASRSRPKEHLRSMSLARAIAVWSLSNLFSEMVRRRFEFSCRVRLEDLVRDPGATLESLVRFCDGFGLVPPAIAPGGAVTLKPGHGVGGNPDKFFGRRATIAPRAWSLPAWRRHLVTCACGPQLALYGYFRDRAPSERAS